MDPKNSNRVGSRKVTKKIENTRTKEDIQNAIHELDSLPEKSVREVAKQFGLSKSTIRFGRKKILAGSDIKKAGRKCAFDRETETSLTECISLICNYGFSPAMVKITVSSSDSNKYCSEFKIYENSLSNAACTNCKQALVMLNWEGKNI